MASYMQLLGTDTPNSRCGCCYYGMMQTRIFEGAEEPSAALSDGYLFFNCPEGTQRFSSEANIKLTKLKSILYTRWGGNDSSASTAMGPSSSVMGTPGMLFTVNDAGLRTLAFFGPGKGYTESAEQSSSGVSLFIETMRKYYFTYRPMNFRLLSSHPTGEYNASAFLPPPQLRGNPVVLEEQVVLAPDTASFFRLILPLNPFTLLVAFATSGEATRNTTDEVYSYCIVHSPIATFDHDAAEALGVPKGPLYGKLKNNESVFVSPEDFVKAAAKRKRGKKALVVEEPIPQEGFWVHPHQVLRQTLSSTKVYLNLVLDSNTPEELRASLEALMGVGEAKGHLIQLLEERFPDFLFYRKEADNSDSPLVRRELEMGETFHLQSLSYFQEFASSGDGDAMYRQYTAFLLENVLNHFTHVFHDFSTALTDSQVEERGRAYHLFSSYVGKLYTAFPTALTHRYHLNSIAPHLFPVSSAADNERPLGYWPYSFKFSCVPQREKSEKTNVSGQYIKYPTQSSAMHLLSDKFRHFLENRATSTDSLPSEHMGGSLVFLGTGSAIPSKYRNVSGTLLQLKLPSVCFSSCPPTPGQPIEWRRGIIILDFGEGNAGQVAQLLSGMKDGEEGNALQSFLQDMVLVFISHGHADHHLGVMTLLDLRHEYLYAKDKKKGQEKLLLVCPEEVYDFMNALWFQAEPYCHWIHDEVEFEVIRENGYQPQARGGSTTLGGKVALLPKLTSLFDDWNRNIATSYEQIHSAPLTENLLWDAEVFTVDHPAHAHALVLRFPSITKTLDRWESKVFLFSGDTRPCEALVQRCRAFTSKHAQDRVFICLHEATFGPGFEMEAQKRKHSTLGEAVKVHEQIEAQFLVLNHFSQRYPKLPGLTDDFVESTTQRDLLHAQAGRNKPTGDELTTEEVAEPITTKLSFSFDLMQLDFATIERGEVYGLTPQFIHLLEEYASWEVGTTKRLRE
ncbi:ribonuclease Z [Angomonas deanei]|uniref:ribonuclease Z n=1 Tax=Angomonas deanei TaxID=59799 RepID=A0A7G2CB35_9TRYP|nr:ribonuclease Z [Angomonas deanei]CAD2217080.1 hypothetical protein, conserved [Angomonas deanei]|eukprot:EPY24102.1 ribonuclease Z [Angomonas deanei]